MVEELDFETELTFSNVWNLAILNKIAYLLFVIDWLLVVPKMFPGVNLRPQ